MPLDGRSVNLRLKPSTEERLHRVSDWIHPANACHAAVWPMGILTWNTRMRKEPAQSVAG
jgi:hypothetical protein